MRGVGNLFSIACAMWYLTNHVVNSSFDILQKRLQRLRHIGFLNPRATCGSNGFLILKKKFGRHSNFFIQICHGLWLAETSNRTLVVPSDMKDVFKYFNLENVQRQFCFVFDDELGHVEYVTKLAQRFFGHAVLQAHYSFFMDEYLISKPSVNGHLVIPAHGNRTIHEVSVYFVRFYAALWGSIKADVISEVDFVIEQMFGGSMGFTSIHKRSLEGACARHLSSSINLTDYSETELPMSHCAWRGDLSQSHPLCDFPPSFVSSCLELHNRSKSLLFVAHDSEASVADLIQLGAISVDSILSIKKESKSSRYQPEKVYSFTTARNHIDMAIAIHSDLFILNPRR